MFRTLSRRRNFPASGVITTAFIVVIALVAAACSDDVASSTEADRIPAPTAIAAPAAVGAGGELLTLTVIDGGSTTGKVITDHRGFAVYGLRGETPTALQCVDECLASWPPLMPRDLAVGAPLDLGLLATFDRPDGTTQVTYQDIPLYLWAGDREIGITGGAGIAGTWFALTETGGYLP